MLVRAVHNNRLLTLGLVPLIMLGLWARFFVLDITHVTIHDNPSMPLWDALVMPVFGYSRFAAALLSFALALATGLTVNRIVSKHTLLSRQSMLPLFVFAMLSAAFLSIQKLNPIWFFAFFFSLGVERLMGSVDTARPAVRSFDAALLTGVGALFYAKGVFIYPILFLVMGVLRVANYRSLIASLMGFLFPFAMSFTYFFATENMAGFLEHLNENLVSNPGQYNHTLYSKIYLGFFILLNAIGVMVVSRYMNVQKVIIRRYFRVFIWLILLVGIAVLSPFFSNEILPIAIIGSTVIISFWIDKISKPMVKEGALWVITLLTVFGQFFLN